MCEQYATSETLSSQWSTVLCMRTGIRDYGQLPRWHGNYSSIIHSLCLWLDTHSLHFNSFQLNIAASKIDSFYYCVLQKFNTKSQECVKRKRLPCDLTEMPQCSKIGEYLSHQVGIIVLCIGICMYTKQHQNQITIINLKWIGRYALDTNCSCFYMCDKYGEEFVPKLYQCPGPSLYSPTLNRCSYSCRHPPTEVISFFSVGKMLRCPNYRHVFVTR